MKERPILFSGEMVRVILDGQKTQTRRVVKFDPKGADSHWHEVVLTSTPPDEHGRFGFWATTERELGDIVAMMPCPYGQVGDRLWVRETHARFSVGEGKDRPVPECVAYRATCSDDGGFDYVNGRGEVMRLNVTKWTPAIHMPRFASRISLEITGIRAERIQNISMDDAVAEGILGDSYLAVEGYRDLWNELNADRGYPWESNPWVWVIEFKHVEVDK